MFMSWFVLSSATAAPASWFDSPTVLVAIVAIVGIIVTALGSIIAVVWMLGNWKGTVETRLGPLEGFGEWKGKVDERLRSFEDRLQEFKETLDGFKETLDEFRQELFGRRPLRTKSPATLSDYGEKLAAFMRASEWAARTATLTLPEVVNKLPFEIEEFSRAYVASRLDPEITKRVSACAYEFGIPNLDNVRSVLWVVLRDELIKRAHQQKAD